MANPIDGFLPGRLTRRPLIPEAGAASSSLVAVIAVMAFMASVALAGFIVVSDASTKWTNDLRGSITVQIKGTNVQDIAQETQRALDFLKGTDGVVTAQAFSRQEAGRLLEPWLGRDNLPADLPVPGIISMEVTRDLKSSLPTLRETIRHVAANAVIDDHAKWNDSLTASALAGKLLAFAVFVLVSLAGCAVIIFATKAGLAANRETLAVLHLVGATDQYIASQVQRRFILLSLRGAFIGVSIAALALCGVHILLSQHTIGGYFLPPFALGWAMAFWLLLIPCLVSGVAAITSRVTVMRTLRANEKDL